jgi:hypothetical protein
MLIPNITRAIKSRRMRLMGYASCMAVKRCIKWFDGKTRKEETIWKT